MRLEQHTKYIDFKHGDTVFSFLPSGDIHSFTQGCYLINGFLGTQKEGSVNNIWLRVYGPDSPRSYPLLGIASASMVSQGTNELKFNGVQEGVNYCVSFRAAGGGLWFWDVELSGSGQSVDIVYGQDIGVGIQGGILTNELYLAQYLGHSVFESENGWVVASRQNQPQEDGQFPYLQQGMLRGKAVGYSTDATQFFGLSYKDTQVPSALAGNLENRNLQFELSYTALQTERICLNGAYSAAFYGLFRKDHPDAVRELEYRAEVKDTYARAIQAKYVRPVPPVKFREEYGSAYSSPLLSEEEIKTLYPERKLEERKDGALWSFFTGDHAHVVLKWKELCVERPHGTILTTLVNPEQVDNNLLTTTNYIYGLFNAQTVVGNTSYHKFISTQRGLLNLLKNHGQRLYVKMDGQYRLLALPAVYEMGMNYSRWIYRVHDDLLTITVFTVAQSPSVVLEMESRNGCRYDLLLTTQLVMGDGEFFQPVMAEQLSGNTLRFTPDTEFWAFSAYPGLCYDFQMEGDFAWSDDRVFFQDNCPRNGTFLTVSATNRSRFRTIITGWLEGAPERVEMPTCNFSKEKAAYLAAYQGLTAGFHLESAQISQQAEQLNETVWWYTHNAMVHFAVPHGLEQAGGAAWGTRDICQGPFEYFLSTCHFSLARDVLCRIFSHQQSDTGEWPQWFMFDRYTNDAGECHGDVVFWPLKCVADYLAATGDQTVLAEKAPFTRLNEGVSREADTLLAHIRCAVDSIRARFLPGSFLVSYGGGDWDDTLQPADPAMKEHMVSAWTQALAYQVLCGLGCTLGGADPEYARELQIMANEVRLSFHQYLVPDGVIAGFAFQNGDGSFLYMLHPSDNQTGIHYRLLPQTRSIIAELVGLEQAEANCRIIDENLKCPDGVRLMDHPSRYDGGVSHLFQRAEQAANVGREISLQYVHAHIRYIEAMAKLGNAQNAWNALFAVNPILIHETVANALPRQSNVYFSSSEGAFSDRYEYSRDFQRLFDGSIPVKGGWRLYSSGPGIYLSRLIRDILGLRVCGEWLEFDPILPQPADGMRLTFRCFGKEMTFIFRFGTTLGPEIYSGQEKLKTQPAMQNPYRTSGIRLHKGQLADKTELDIYFPHSISHLI